MRWGYLQRHRMFEATVFAVPSGYKVEVRVRGTDGMWADAVAPTVAAAMHAAFKEADTELKAGRDELRRKVRK